MTIQENLKIAVQVLRKENIEEPTRKARLLLCYVLGVEKEYLVIYANQIMQSKEEEKYKSCLQQLVDNTPIQYITNHQEFMKLDFYVDENVLIPRQDTEILVEEAISYCKKEKKDHIKILDLCTGSGAIAISIKRYVPNCEVIATDINKKALEVAKKNAKKNGVADIIWIESDLFEKLEGSFDLIVSNPPYIKKEEIKNLDIQVQKEPIIALDGGEDGLIFYKKIIQLAPNYLTNKGAIFFEIGYEQKEEVSQMLKKTNQYKIVEEKKDLAGNDRVVMAFK